MKCLQSVIFLQQKPTSWLEIDITRTHGNQTQTKPYLMGLGKLNKTYNKHIHEYYKIAERNN